MENSIRSCQQAVCPDEPVESANTSDDGTHMEMEHEMEPLITTVVVGDAASATDGLQNIVSLVDSDEEVANAARTNPELEPAAEVLCLEI